MKQVVTIEMDGNHLDIKHHGLGEDVLLEIGYLLAEAQREIARRQIKINRIKGNIQVVGAGLVPRVGTADAHILRNGKRIG